MNYKRWQLDAVIKSLSKRRVLLLVGARQCGKTTLALGLSSPQTLYRNLDDTVLLEAALNDPYGFIKHGDETLIIDEIQRAPGLLQAIKLDVDRYQHPGRFLLTGSANIDSLPQAKESLAGRVRRIRLRPLSQGELHHAPPAFLEKAFGGLLDRKSPLTKDDYLKMALKGGYPEPLTFENLQDSLDWHEDYLRSLLERDLRDIVNIRRKDSMQALTYILAAWSSKFMDITNIGSRLNLAHATLTGYIKTLETLFIIERVPAWTKTDYQRISHRDKLFITDTGLMASLLKWNFEKIQFDGERHGKLVETFVFTQLASLIDSQEEPYVLYHYKDRDRHEIDFIIENSRGDILGIEVKSGSSVSKESFKNLIWFKNYVAKDKIFRGMVLYSGAHSVSFGDNLYAVPLDSLWQTS